MNEWQPIGTAPRTAGKEILTYDTDGSILMTVWCDPCEHDDPGGWEGSDTAQAYSAFTPTHWMPLPDPPEDADT